MDIGYTETKCLFTGVGVKHNQKISVTKILTYILRIIF